MSSTCGKGKGSVKLEVTVYEPCTKHTRTVEGGRVIPQSTQFCGCTPVISRQTVNEHDLQTGQFAQMGMALFFASTQTIRDTSNATHSVAAGATASAPTIVAGIGTTAAAVSDYKLQTPTTDTPAGTGAIAATISAATESGTSGSYTITGSLTNGSAALITYAEIGVQVTIATYIYLLTHDVTTTPFWPVSVGGTLACTITITNA